MVTLSSELVLSRAATFDLATVFMLDLKACNIRHLSESVMSGLSNVEWLDLSNNKLTSNELKLLDGANMTKLAKLSLDHNAITSLTSMGTVPSLVCLSLVGNMVQSLDELRSLAAKAPALTALHLRTPNQTNTNPVCSESSYRQSVMEWLPQLQVLDGDRVRSEHQISLNRVTAQVSRREGQSGQRAPPDYTPAMWIDDQSSGSVSDLGEDLEALVEAEAHPVCTNIQSVMKECIRLRDESDALVAEYEQFDHDTPQHATQPSAIPSTNTQHKAKKSFISP